MEEKKADKENTKKKPGKRKVYFFRWLLFFLLLPIFLSLIIQIPLVQKITIDYISQKFAEKIERRVEIGHVYLNIFEGLELNNFYIEGQYPQDTLIAFDKINISLSRNLLTLIKGDLKLRALELAGSRIKTTKAKGETRNDLTILLEKLKGSSVDSQIPGKPLKVTLGVLGLKDINYEVKDLNTFSTSTYNVDEATVEFEDFSSVEETFIIKSFYAKNPIVKIVKGSGDAVTVESEGLEDVSVTQVEQADTTKELFSVRHLEIENGTFIYQDQKAVASNYPNAIDLKNFQLFEIALKADSLVYSDQWSVTGDLKALSFVDNKNFVLENVSSENFVISQEEVNIPRLIIKTERSNILSDFAFVFDEFSDFRKFTEEVYIKADLNNTTLAIDDLIHFVPNLGNSKFFAYNGDKIVQINGMLRGTVDNLSGRDLTLAVNNRFFLRGSFGTINLTDADNALVNLKVERLNTSMNFLRNFIPSFTPPKNFFKLGQITFDGRFDGYFQDFVAFGNLGSELGQAILDMRLDVKQGNELANYSGSIRLIDFDLARWSGNPELDKATFNAQVKDGKGLTLATAVATLEAEVESFIYKDYQYNNLTLNGTLDKNQFNGVFSVQEDHLDLDFDGEISYNDNIFKLDLFADIRKLGLQALNISDKFKDISGQLTANVTGTSLIDLVGVAQGSNLIIAADTIHQIDTFSLFSDSIPGQKRKLVLFSNIATVTVEGNYDLNDVIPQVKQLLKQNYPYHTRNWKIIEKKYKDNVFDIEIDVVDTRRLLELADVDDLVIKGLRSKGNIDSRKSIFNFDTDIRYVRYQDKVFYETDLIIGNRSDDGFLVLNIDSTLLRSRRFNPLYFEGDFNRDTLNFILSTENLADSVEMVNIIGNLTPDPNGYKLNLKDKELIFLGKKWDIFKDNSVVINREFVGIRDLILSDGYREIEIKDIDNEGISLDMRRFNFLLINELIDYDKIDFSGEGEVNLRIDNILGKDNYIQARMFVEDFRLNNESFGSLDINFDKDRNNVYKALIAIDKGVQYVKANVDYDANTKLVEGFLRAKKIPLDIFEMIIPEGISETKGTGEVQATLKGSSDDLKLDGEAYLTDCGVKIDYLGTSFFMDKETIKISENFIDLSGSTLLDVEGNPGTITGGLSHTLFKDFRLALSMYSPDAIIIKTTRSENPLYYGVGRGEVQVDFSGDFGKPNFDVEATTRAGTILNIPVEYSTTTNYEESFITFVEKEDLFAAEDSDFRDVLNIEGVNVDINLTMTDEADVRIIFNEKLGDVIEGSGRGDMQISILRTGEFEIFGDYEILEGEYLFTARNIVAKPFNLRRGGRVRWTGDPINAELDIKADYLVRTPLNTFLLEFMVPGSDAYREATNIQNVNLILELGGTLYAPMVNFDLEFPDLVGELNSFAQSKLRTLKTNKVALNSQVFGLLVANRFLPDNNPLNNFGSYQLVKTSISTIGEFVTSQASRYLTSLLQEALTENSLIAGIDFQIGLTANSNAFGNEANNSDYYPDEITVNLRNRFRFWDERLSLGAGVNYVRESPLQGRNDYYIPNIVIEYFLTDDRNLKLRFYGRRDVDEINVNDRRDRIGLGLGYRKEFGSISNVIESIKMSVKEESANQ